MAPVVDPADIPRVLLDAARLVKRGEIVVFGSAALAFALPDPPRTHDIDLWCDDPARGELVSAVMGELSWYHEQHGVYVEVWAPETFAAPEGWRSRSAVLTDASVPEVRMVVPHPHDVLFAKLERWEPGDRAHAALILAALPLSEALATGLADRSPYRRGRITEPRRTAAFEAHFLDLLRIIHTAPRR